MKIPNDVLERAFLDCLMVSERMHKLRGPQREAGMATEVTAIMDALLAGSRVELAASVKRYVKHAITSDPSGLEGLEGHFSEILERV